MKLVANWKLAHRWLSMHAMILAGAIQGAWLYIPPDMKTSIPPAIVNMLTLALLCLGIAGRLVDQKKAKRRDNPE